MTEAAALSLLLVLVSPVAGSFLGVLVDRLPRGLSILWPGSACRGCGRRLGVRDLVPVLSFALARGRCRHCGAVIPPWLLYLEIAATGAGILAVILAPTPLSALLVALVLWLLLALAVSDLLHFRLPDALTGALALVALAWAWLSGDIAAALSGGLIGAGSFLALRRGYRALRGREGLGLGDVKLMAGLGALSGPLDLPLLVLVAALLGLAGAALSGDGWRAGRALPFGAALAAAGAAVWLAPMIPN